MSKLTFDLIAAGDSSLDEGETGRARTRAVIWLTAALWLANYAFGTLGAYLAGGNNLLLLSVIRAGMLCIGLLLCAALHKLLRSLSHIAFSRRVAAVMIMSVIAAEIYGWIYYLTISNLAPGVLAPSIRWSVAISNLSTLTWFFLAWAGLRIALEYSWEIADSKRRALALQDLAHSAKLRALHSQINPHFLFNSLNSIAALIADERRRDADLMVGKLADFFRMTLSAEPETDIPLRQEIELQSAYLTIEQLRYPDLELKLAIDPQVAEALIPALLLQPIVENAVKYGVASSSPPAMISIAARLEDGKLTIIVEDRGNASAAAVKPGAGIGLNNVRARLHERYGGDAALVAERIGDVGFRVTVRMPLEFA